MEFPCKEVSDPALLQVIPKVSVAMLAYNHSAFITEAIEGVAMQKTAFPFELVIGVDRSQDNTLEIALQYQKLYPTLIRVLVPEQRLGMHTNCYSTLSACRGTYIAFCEGDDFWIHPEKLNRQVDLLETDPSLAGCFHDFYCLNQRTGKRWLFVGNRQIDVTPDIASVICEKNIGTCSVLYRNCVSISELATLAEGFLQIDHALWLLVLEHGVFKYLAEPMAVYRIHDGGAYSTLGAAERRRLQLRFKCALIASNRYPSLQELLLASKRNDHRQYAIALAWANKSLKSVCQYVRSIGPKAALKGNYVRSSTYWLTFVRKMSCRLGVEAPLLFIWKHFRRIQRCS